MSALGGIMGIYRERDDHKNTIRICERMLELCEDDNMGICYVLILSAHARRPRHEGRGLLACTDESFRSDQRTRALLTKPE